MANPKPKPNLSPIPERTSGCAALACMVNSEIGTVLAVMRRNDCYTGGSEATETSLVRGLRRLRRDIFLGGQPDIFFLFSPFLDVVRSDQTNASVTGVALSAVYKLLSLQACSSPEAVRRVIQSVTKCRFEVTDPTSEEIVLMKILQVLLACARNPALQFLCDRDVCLLVHTCFRVVHQAATKGELLQRTARHTMHEIMCAIFARFPHFNDSNCQVSPIAGSKPALANRIRKVHVNHTHMLDIGTSSNGDDNSIGDSDGEMEPYGVAGIIDIFCYLCSLLNIVDSAVVSGQNLLTIEEDIPLFALGLINSSIELGGQTFGSYPELLFLVQDDLFRSLMQLGLSMNPLILSKVCSIVLNLYHHLRTHLKLQLEAFFSCVILRLTQGKFGSIYQQQEVAMEALVDFCRQPDFMPEMYANFDCDITCSNIFEDLINLLSKSAFPVNCPLSAMNILALDGLIAIIHRIAERVDVRSSFSSPNQSDDSKEAAQDYQPFWVDKCDDYKDPACWVEFAKRQKRVKQRLMIGADHFNRDPKKGLEFLQGIHLLPDRLDPQSVAFFFRYTIGLDKSLLGDFLGDPEEFHSLVLTEFARTFDFRGMSLDTALRVFLETFRLPGEAQRIQRVLEAFAEQYYEQSPQIFADKDTALILAYSLILLNTDQHNSQVRRKMSEEDFIKNNRGINSGQDLPREYLSMLYHSIVGNEIKMLCDKGSGFLEMTPNRWIGLLCKSREVAPYITYDSQSLDHSMFSAISGPAIAAISVVFDHSKDNEVLRTCVEGFLAVAKISASYQIEDAVDDLVASLSKFTTLLNLTSSADEAMRDFGDGTKAHLACEMMFNIASKYGDSIRIGWRSIVDCILRLHKLGLLPVRGAMSNALDGGVNTNANIESMLVVPPPGSQRRTLGLIGRFSQLLSLESEEPRSQPTERLASHRRARKAVEAYCIHNIFLESKFLQADSLLHLVRALVWAAGHSQKRNDEDTAVVCLELLMIVTLNNRDRIMLLWPVTSEHIAAIIQTTAGQNLVLVEKAVFALLHICQRLLPYKEDLSEELLSSLQLILKLDVSIAEVLCERIAQELMQLVQANAGHIKSPVGWVTISSLLCITARHPKASAAGFEALSLLMAGETHVMMDNFALFLDAAFAFADARAGGEERSLQALNLIMGSAQYIAAQSNSLEGRAERREKELGKYWIKLVDGLKGACLDPRENVRDSAILSLTTSISTADWILLSEDMLMHCIQDIVFVLLDNLLDIALVYSPKEYQNMEITLHHAMKLLSKVFLQYLDQLTLLPTFCILWLGVLDRIEKYFKAKIQGMYSKKIQEVIPEMLKNMLLILHEKGVLIQSSDKNNDSLWELTWQHVEEISPLLRGELFSKFPSNSSESKQVDYIQEQSITKKNFVSSPVAEED